MKSRVHRNDKTRYPVTNSREYESVLVQRGDVTVWLSPDAIEAAKAKPSGRRAAQPRSSTQLSGPEARRVVELDAAPYCRRH